MYTIGNVIYGVPVDLDKLPLKVREDDGKLKEMGIETAYSGSALHVPAWAGVNVGEVDETEDVDLHYVMTEAFKKVAAKDKGKVKKMVSGLPKGVAKGEIGLWIVWSTS